jgi:hypothetical protein
MPAAAPRRNLRREVWDEFIVVVLLLLFRLERSSIERDIPAGGRGKGLVPTRDCHHAQHGPIGAVLWLAGLKDDNPQGRPWRGPLLLPPLPQGEGKRKRGERRLRRG